MTLEACDCGSAQENHGWACRCDNPPSKRQSQDAPIRELVMDPANDGRTARLLAAIQAAPLVDEWLIDRVGNEEVNVAAGLSAKELEVLAAASEGLLDRPIAERLGKSVWTVKDQLQSAMVKLGASNRTAACCEALRRGLIV